MTASIPVSLLEGWINELRSSLKQECQEANSGRDFSIKQGMSEGLGVIWHKITTWLRHQKYVQTLRRSERKFLVVRRVNLSGGRYRKLEWYEDDLFVTLAWRHGMHEEVGELMLEIRLIRYLRTHT